MTVQMAVLASGSQGNSTLLQVAGSGLLIDVGLGPRALATRLESVGSTWERISSAILTHTHGDHVNNATLLQLARLAVPFYCHEGHRIALSHLPGFQALEQHRLVRHYDETPFLSVNGLGIEPLELSHDGGPTYGFRVEARADRRTRPVAIGYLADTGHWTDAMADAMSHVDLLGIEFNHDVEMQRLSPRSPRLIARNLGDRGHLSNRQGADFVKAVLDRSAPGSLRHLVLLHLSQQCNHPTLAVGTARETIRPFRRRIAVHAASQSIASPNLLISPAAPRKSETRAEGVSLPF